MSQDSVGLAALEQQVSRVVSELERLRAHNRELEADDMPQVRAIVQRSAAQNHTLPAIVSGIVSSDAFRMRAAEREEIPNPKAQIPNPKAQIPNPKSQSPRRQRS